MRNVTEFELMQSIKGLPKAEECAPDNLSLTVINDGDGSQCGSSYKSRCEAFRLNVLPATRQEFAQAWVNAANAWMMRRGYAGADSTTLLLQACAVAEYYAEHVTE